MAKNLDDAGRNCELLYFVICEGDDKNQEIICGVRRERRRSSYLVSAVIHHILGERQRANFR